MKLPYFTTLELAIFVIVQIVVLAVLVLFATGVIG